MADLAQMKPFAIGIDALHGLGDQGDRLDHRAFGGEGAGGAFAAGGGDDGGGGGGFRLGLGHDVFDQDKAVADLAQAFGGFGFTDANDLKPFFADTAGEPCEIAVGADQHKAIELALVQDVHRVDH